MTAMESVTVLSMGLGRDSITMLCLLVEGRLLVDGEQIHASQVDAVVFADPGYEWAHTYAVERQVTALCLATGVRYLRLSKPPKSAWEPWLATRVKGDRTPPPWCDPATAPASIEGRAASGYYHKRSPIIEDYQRTGRITIRASAGCTFNHKVLPIRRVLAELAAERFGAKNNSAWSRLVKAGKRPAHRMLLGIAADEAQRAEGAEAKDVTETYVRPVYPLLEMGISKADEADTLSRFGLNHVRKSGCVACHYQKDAHFWALSKTDPVTFARIVVYERAALATNDKMYLRSSKKQGRTIDVVVRLWGERNPGADPETILTAGYGRCGGAM